MDPRSPCRRCDRSEAFPAPRKRGQSRSGEATMSRRAAEEENEEQGIESAARLLIGWRRVAVIVAA